jgi:hypothetical protein
MTRQCRSCAAWDFPQILTWALPIIEGGRQNKATAALGLFRHHDGSDGSLRRAAPNQVLPKRILNGEHIWIVAPSQENPCFGTGEAIKEKAY